MPGWAGPQFVNTASVQVEDLLVITLQLSETVQWAGPFQHCIFCPRFLGKNSVMSLCVCGVRNQNSVLTKEISAGRPREAFHMQNLISEPPPVLFGPPWASPVVVDFSPLTSVPFAPQLLEREGDEIGCRGKEKLGVALAFCPTPSCDKNLWQTFQRAFL